MKKLTKGNSFSNFKYDTASQTGLDFFKETNGKKAIVSFLRYNGCPVCKMEMADYKRDYKLLNDKNTELFVVLQSPQSLISKKSVDANFPFTIICDPKGVLFDKFEVKADLINFLNPKGLAALIKATFKGHMHGKFEGKETQMPATFVIDENRKVTFAHYGKHINDAPRLDALLPYL